MDDHGPTAQPQVRVFRATDDVRYLATDELVWFDEPSRQPAGEALEGVPPDQRFAAELDDESAADLTTYAGVYGVRPLLLTVPGGPGAPRQVPAAGLTFVGVHPDLRRRGVLRAMMRHHLEQTRAEATPVSLLHCSESGIYGRYGYGIAGLEHSPTLGRGTTFTAPHLDEPAARITTRTVTITDPGVAERLRASDLVVAASEVGTLVFDPGFYRRIARLEGSDLRDKEPWRVLFATLEGRDVGNAIFRRRHKWEDGRPVGELEVLALYGDPAARLALLRRLVDFDLMGTVKLDKVGPDDPLWHWLPGPREVSNAKPCDNVWVRIIDLPAALAARGYEADCDLVVEIVDELMPDNAGAWRLTVRDGECSATRSAEAPELRLSIAQLGAAWLGWANLVAMLRAGVLAEARPGAARDLWRALRTDLAAWPSSGF